MLKFYCYNFTQEKTTPQIIEEINYLCERTKQFEREEEIMLFVFVPAVSLEAVCAAIPDRKLVKISSQSFSVTPVSNELTPGKLKEIGADMAITGLADRRYFLGTAAEKIARQIKTGYSRIPYETHYRIGTIYRPLWDFTGGYTADGDYTLSMFRTIRRAVTEALPGFPIEMPLFYGGMLSTEKLASYFESGIIDGVFWDSKNITADEFVNVINTIG